MNAEEYATGPRHLITVEKVTSALKSDKGNDAKLIHWEIKEFVKIGENYRFYVTSVDVKYSTEGEDYCVSYIVKVNPHHDVVGSDMMVMVSVIREGEFYNNIVPKINSHLKSVGLEPLCVPKCFYECRTEGEEMLILEDLRQRGFRRSDMTETETFDDIHLKLVLEAFARFHASSFLAIKEYPPETFKKLESVDEDIPHNVREEAERFSNDFFGNAFAFVQSLLEYIGGYEKMVQWLKEHQHNPVGVMKRLSSKPSAFDAITHGDVSQNNILIRYGDSGSPIEVMFVDFQWATKTSLVKDLHDLFIRNLSPSLKNSNKDKLLSLYCETFCSTVEAAGGGAAPFTLQELLQEFECKQEYGLIEAAASIHFEFISSGPPEYSHSYRTKEQWDEYIKKHISVNEVRSGKFPIIHILDEFFSSGFPE